MDNQEFSAKTVDEAVQKALAQLGVSRDQVRITILNEGKHGGLFGIGSEEAQIRVDMLTPEKEKMGDIFEIAKEALGNIVKLMGVDGEVVVETYPDETGKQDAAPIGFDIEGDDLGILIGRRGQTLAALQYIVRLIAGHKTGVWVPIVVDAESYKKRRIEALKTLAQRMAENVIAKGTPFTLEPMPPYERRIVHMALANNSSVFTESIGDGDARKVIIHPKGNANGKPGNRNSGGGHKSRPGNRPGFNRRPY